MLAFHSSLDDSGDNSELSGVVADRGCSQARSTCWPSTPKATNRCPDRTQSPKRIRRRCPSRPTGSTGVTDEPPSDVLTTKLWPTRCVSPRRLHGPRKARQSSRKIDGCVVRLASGQSLERVALAALRPPKGVVLPRSHLCRRLAIARVLPRSRLTGGAFIVKRTCPLPHLPCCGLWISAPSCVTQSMAQERC